MTTKQLHNLIDRYFSGDTTLEQERLLLKELLSTQASDEKIQGAKAVMCYLQAMPAGNHPTQQQPARNKWRMARRAISVAAMIAVVLALAFGLRHSQVSSPQDECLAWVNGEKIVDSQLAISLMESQLAMIDDASEALADEVAFGLEALSEGFDDNKRN